MSPAALTTPGKIIAVHLNYPSRAQERGRTPAHPSYFFKPSSSVTPSGASVERPLGTELLGFEGEIALVIGTRARRVQPADGWSHVKAITAANDLGLYDLRDADRGSNVRSKGGDGFTPLGPRLIPAAGLAADGWRIRTWINGALAQQDTSDTLLFDFGTLIADLSQMLTLEPDDVILTGTPAGASVAVPGDVLEVEVDAPGYPGAPTTGRLITTVTQGGTPFGSFGSSPEYTRHQAVEAWGSEDAVARAATAGRARAIEPAAEPASAGSTLTPEQREQLQALPTATLSAALRRRGHVDIFIDGVRPLGGTTKLVGTARTLRMVPFRPDLFASHGGGFNAQKQAFDTIGSGEVLVVEARRDSSAGTVGDVLALRAKVRGAAGIVTDGAVRDAQAVAEIGLTVFSQGAHPSVLGRRHVPWETDVTIACGGAAVVPGDIIVGDTDGVLVIPAALVDEVITDARRQEDEDAWVAGQVADGHPVDGLFPMNAQWRARYEGRRT